jgi:hypothetical protein
MSTSEIKKAYRSKQQQQQRLAPIATSPIKKKSRKSVKAVAYSSDIVNLPAVKMTGQPSIRTKYSEVRATHYLTQFYLTHL